jgi:hypothetical protein
MVDVVVLPPQKEPERPTAQYYSKTLYEHFIAFQNQNNKSGFKMEEPTITIELIPVEKIIELENASAADCLLLFAQHQYVTEEQFKNFMFFIKKKMTVPNVFRPKMFWIYQMLAHLFGYRTHEALKAYARKEMDEHHPGMIRNFLGDKDSAARALFASYSASERKEKLKSSPAVKQAFKEGRDRINAKGASVSVSFKKTRKVLSS